MGDQELASFPCTRVDNDSEIALGQAMAVLDGQSLEICQLIAVEGYAYDEVSERLNLSLDRPDVHPREGENAHADGRMEK